MFHKASRGARGESVKPRVVIAGSGLAGLACAVALAGRAECAVFERLPVIGGEDWADERLAQLVRRAAAAGVQFVAGTQAVRWDGRSLLAVGQRTRQLDADVLVVATGHRPLTRAELGIQGVRCGGILPVTVALHLLRHRVSLGHAPLVIGGGGWASQAVSALLDSPARHVTVLAPDGVLAPLAGPPRVDVHPGARPVGIGGGDRVSVVEAVTPSGESVRHPCDAVVLAHGLVPYRNIDGAIDNGPGIVFAQAGSDRADDNTAETVGRVAAEQALDLVGRERTVQELTLRIGGPRESNVASR